MGYKRVFIYTACFVAKDFQGNGLGSTGEGIFVPIGVDQTLPRNPMSGLGHSLRKRKSPSSSDGSQRKKREEIPVEERGVFKFLNGINRLHSKSNVQKLSNKNKATVQEEKALLEKHHQAESQLREKLAKLKQALARNQSRDRVIARRIEEKLSATEQRMKVVLGQKRCLEMRVQRKEQRKKAHIF